VKVLFKAALEEEIRILISDSRHRVRHQQRIQFNGSRDKRFDIYSVILKKMVNAGLWVNAAYGLD
jgi:hypothetical protein